MAQDPSPGRRYGGKTAAERDQERRERLLDAGLELFGDPAATASIEELCRRARVTTRHFYALFSSAEEVLLALDARIVAGAAEGVRRALDAGPADLAGRIDAALRAYAAPFVADPRASRVHFVLAYAAGGDGGARRRTAGAPLAAVLGAESARLSAAGAVADRDLTRTWTALMGATSFLLTDWADGADPADLETVIADLVRLFVAGLTAT
ncbi:Transcriptional regulator TetR family [Patulibacter medicamentivorans]|uniref:Transcriptional regulator TetR family n=1 Tax=Patulibacter medicamentivorans TaxID=1097667 RepID=H0EBP4_9ACTN|nr:TetR/AcrR family transcriptional regulator [Patulibacter medicamentivorans]EHN08906.1 Transcriptional regulator TetR family [Patulibacter medicamentivorans]